MPDDFYVLLTGAINNAGDFLIRERAISLLSKYRPDRKIIEYNRWEPLTKNKIDIVNESRALILTGGPAIRSDIYPSIYPLVDNLNNIKVPILAYGLGCKTRALDVSATSRYRFSSESKKLLSRINDSGYLSSVRDDYSLEVMLLNDYSRFIMTGCPAMYEPDMFKQELIVPKQINSIVMSLGVSYRTDKYQEQQMKNVILELNDMYPEAVLTVALHHATDLTGYNFPNSTIILQKKGQSKFIEWLNIKNISYAEISCSTKKMMDLYLRCDLHVGYRVHAHLLMCSISRPTLLIAEDSRGVSIGSVSGGLYYSAYISDKNSIIEKVLNKIRPQIKRYCTDPSIHKTIKKNLEYEKNMGYPRMRRSRNRINVSFGMMKQYLLQLP